MFTQKDTHQERQGDNYLGKICKADLPKKVRKQNFIVSSKSEQVRNMWVACQRNWCCKWLTKLCSLSE